MLAKDCGKHPGLSVLGSEEGPDSSIASAVAIRGGKHCQRGAVRARGRAISGSDRLYGGHPGWPGELAAVGQDAERIGHGVLAESRRHYSTDAAHRRFQGPNRAALAGDIESPR